MMDGLHLRRAIGGARLFVGFLSSRCPVGGVRRFIKFCSSTRDAAVNINHVRSNVACLSPWYHLC